MSATQCQVLRCGEPAVDRFDLERFGTLHPFSVCAPHQAHLAGGGDWRVFPDGDSLQLACHPDDLIGDGLLLMVDGGDAGLDGTAASWTSRREYVATLVLDAAPWGQEDDPGQVRILLTRAQALQLSTELGAVDLFVPDDEA